MPDSLFLLGVDTCGPTGSVALAHLNGSELEVLDQTELAGRTYSATLVAATGELLVRTGKRLEQLDGIVAVNGPGSFTGVRVGLSAVKGLAEPGNMPVLAVSRLEVLAHKAGVPSAALDAHRQEIFLRVAEEGATPQELLAGSAELATMGTRPRRVAVCEDSVSQMLGAAWLGVEVVCVTAPAAADALRLTVPRILSRDFVDLALLDGHYLRRSDAEIFGESETTSF